MEEPVLRGSDVREFRKSLNATADDLGEMIGWTGRQIRRWEQRGAEAVPVSVDHLLGALAREVQPFPDEGWMHGLALRERLLLAAFNAASSRLSVLLHQDRASTAKGRKAA